MLANYLQSGYWTSNATVARRYNLGTTGNNPNNGVLLYNVSGWASDTNGLTVDRQALVREVFKLYSAVLGLNFQETTSTGTEVDFFFRDNAAGAYSGPAGSSFSDGVDWTEINIAANWFGSSSQYNGYTLQTVEHEVGHALGLGHMGNYNGTVDYATQAVYANDSWFVSMMSYLPQNSSPYFAAYNPNTAAAGISYSWLQTPMAADWLALNTIYAPQGYGVDRAFLGDTVYGVGTTITSAVSNVWNQFSVNAGSTTFTLIDGGGYDTLDVSNFVANQVINLAPSSLGSATPSYSNIGGKIGNLTIAVGTIVEAATGGSGADTFYGNDVANTFKGNGGNDSYYDSLGSDIYYGGANADTVFFTESINLFAIAYNPSTSFLSLARASSADVDLVFSDVESISFGGTAYAFSSFVDSTAPTLLSSTPVDNAQVVAAAANIVLNFSETVQAGTGVIVISNGADIRSINIADASQISFAGAAVTINPLLDLAGNSTYSIQLAAGVIKDASGNSYAGISDATTLNFSTAPSTVLAIVASDAIKAEGNSGSTAYTFTVSRSGDLSSSSAVNWSVTGSGANPAAANDFISGVFPSGSVSFAAGEASQLITVLVAGDTVIEADESFAVTLTTATNATISTAVAYGTISNDDGPPPPDLAIVASDAVQAEGNSGSTTYTFTVSRSGDVSGVSSANWLVSGSGLHPADASDFGGSFPLGTVVFAAGVTSQQITVNVSGDGRAEFDEGFTVTLANPSNALISVASANGQILNDDLLAPVVSEITTSATDGNLAIGETIVFSVLFSDVVVVAGTPLLNLANGGSAIYGTGSGTSTLTFVYSVAAANSSTADLSTASANAISTASASIQTILGTPADLSGANAVNPAGLVAVDTTPITVTSLAVDGNTIVLTLGETVTGVNLVASNFSRQIGVATAVAATLITLDAPNKKVTLTFGTVSTANPAPTSTAAVKLSYAATSGSPASGLITDLAGNPLTPFSNQVVDTFQSAASVTTLGDGGTAVPATSYSNLVLTGATAINGNGNALVNSISGNNASNILDGKGGADQIDGLDAGDIYLVALASDHPSAEFRDSGISGVDEVRFSSATANQTLTLYAGDTGLEAAVIGTGTAVAAITTATTALNIDASLVSNGLDITGNAGVNALLGTAYADRLTGNAGVDAMDGREASDLYLIGSSSEHAVAEIKDTGAVGVDEVRFASATAGQTLVLFAGDTGLETAVIGTGTAAAAITSATTALNLDASLVSNALAITGNAGANVLRGTAFVDAIDGGGAADVYLVANPTEHAAAEFKDSGVSGTDEVRFISTTANQTLVLFAGDTGLEAAVIGTGTTAAFVTTGTTALSIDASAVLNGLAITGNAGNNSLQGTAFVDSIVGNAGIDIITGQAGADAIKGGTGLDQLSGGADADTFIYTTLADGLVGGSNLTGRTFEIITDFQVGLDTIDLLTTATLRSVKVLGAVTALTDTAIGSLLNATLPTVNFAANTASTFTFGTSTYLAINDATAGYSSTTDAIIDITGYSFAAGFTSLTSLTIS